MNLSGDWVFALFGAGGSGREIMPIAMDSVARLVSGNVQNRVCFVESSPKSKFINGIRCLSEDEFIELRVERKSFNVSIANPDSRRMISTRWLSLGYQPFTIESRSSEVFGFGEVGEGAIFCGHTSIMPNVRIGKYFHANHHSYVSHDCEIGDFVTFAPNVHCNGNVRIGDQVFVGAGAIIRNGSLGNPLSIGSGAVIGMGAVVTRDVPANTTVVGNPARSLT